jgi:hypothetical protein
MWNRKVLFVLCSLLWTVSLPLTVGAQPFYHAWSDGYGDATSQYAYSIAADGSGNLVVTGWFAGTIDFGGGPLTGAGGQDIFLVKFDAAGNHIWSQRFGDASSQYGYDVTIDAWGNVVLVGYFSGAVDFGGGLLTSAGNNDIFVAKFDAGGNHLWSHRFGDGFSQYGRAVAVDGQGNVLVTGQYYSTVDFGGGPFTSAGLLDIFVIKFDAGGNHLWSRSFGDGSDQYGYAIATDAADNVILTGPFAGSVNFGGGVLTSAGMLDIYVVAFKSSGLHMWSHRFGDGEYQQAHGIAIDGSDNIILVGEFRGTVNFGGGPLTSAGFEDIFVAKFNALGNHLWSRGFGDANNQIALAVCSDGEDNVAVTGELEGTVDFGGGPRTCGGATDFFVVQLDPNGSHLWSERFGDASWQRGHGITADAWGNLIMAGHNAGTVDLGGGPIPAAGSYDVVVAKFWRAPPRIASVRDIPSDQGGWVNLCWDASGADTPTERAITRYTLWRAISPSLAASLLDDGASLVSDPSAAALADAEMGAPLIRRQHLAGTTYYWYPVGSLYAYYLPGYSTPVPTLFDSTAVSNDYHYFQVIAHTANASVFWTSAPDSGYSVDNLAPEAPLSLAGQQSMAPDGLTLSWRACHEADLASYAVYRGLSETFVPAPGNRIATPKDTTTFDDEWEWDSGYYYKVSAVDVHGNESGYAVLGPDGVIGTGGSAVPPATYLGNSYPNPFGRATRITFGLAEAADVSLKVYDVSGRLVRVLVEDNRDARAYEVEWDGTNARGERVASGVYFYHLTAGATTHIRKAVLLR